ncbi:glycine zipper 2TM domain-containing protein [Pigmentiphaga soli]|uniref:Glycine zipper 2TM domain-containing protein n=1 Tax=Pigmentiphaga soli TaxID=1007095 RepID=A0ABP8H126_9BURK
MSTRPNRRAALLAQDAAPAPAPRAPARLHPLLAGAAVSVIVLSAVGVGVMTGLLPSPLARTAPDAAAEQQADALAPPMSAAAARQDAARRFGTAPAQTPAAPALARAPAPVRQAAVERCADCGVVQDVRAYQVEGQGTGIGAVGGGVLGGVVGNQFGGGHGRTVLTVLGALGGAYAGNQVEKRVRTTTRYEMTIRMDDGTVRRFNSASPYAWHSGDPVRVMGGRVVSRDADTQAMRVSG